jgi:hypothetical protein
MIIFFFCATSINAYAVDEEYLKQLKYKVIGMNLKLPKRIDDITTMEEIRIIKLQNGYYVVTMAKIDSKIQSFGSNRELVRKNTIKVGCNDPATLGYMKNGMKIGILYKNSDEKMFDQMTYSLKDCS